MNLNHLTVFLTVAQTRGYTQAARRLGLDKGHVSRVVRALETELGMVLLTRTTRAVALTAAGEQLLAKISEPLAALESATASLEDRPVTPSGLVTVTTTPDLGRTVVAPLVAAFRTRYPAVRVRLLLESSVVALPATRSDLALRVGTLRPGPLKARKLGTLEAGFFASPRYLASRGSMKSLAELARHDGLWPSPQAGRKSFASKRDAPPAAVECEDFGALLELARSGGGVALLPVFLAARDVAQGTLVRVLSDLTFPGAPLSLVTIPERPLPPRVAALRDVLVEHVPAALATRSR
ncbi:LysR family transcriptional regulator [Myxococcus qinghaiensis]|uniref:LysR family transcriptional regulator n=1 Tax=Myxococcus qinghaiensis TaxID=2906758 RepID=UPI0020A7587A|nr:LysR family transcriptional regulator [Myxococcus qinghaiensis]MCP3165608.1 LysR family transcriptional regulator [Myxococcus qinghaiensis]